MDTNNKPKQKLSIRYHIKPLSDETTEHLLNLVKQEKVDKKLSNNSSIDLLFRLMYKDIYQQAYRQINESLSKKLDERHWDAEDISQEIFYKVCRLHIDHIKNPKSNRGLDWRNIESSISRVAKDTHIDYHRVVLRKRENYREHESRKTNAEKLATLYLQPDVDNEVFSEMLSCYPEYVDTLIVDEVNSTPSINHINSLSPRLEVDEYSGGWLEPERTALEIDEFECISNVLANIKDHQKQMFLRYFIYTEDALTKHIKQPTDVQARAIHQLCDPKKIASDYGISVGTLHTQMCRLRSKIEVCHSDADNLDLIWEI